MRSILYTPTSSALAPDCLPPDPRACIEMFGLNLPALPKNSDLLLSEGDDALSDFSSEEASNVGRRSDATVATPGGWCADGALPIIL